jgi:Tfp pilus assembly protein PilO
MIYRRQRQQYIFAGLLVVIAVVNLLFFFILNRPAQTEYAAMQTSIRQLQAEILTSKGSLASTEKTSKQLDAFDKDKNTLLMMHLIPRHTGYSEIVSTLDDMVKSSGVNKTRVSFNLDPKPRAGLNSVSITIPLQGGYNNVVEFIRELERSDTLFLITEIQLSTTAEPTVPAGPQQRAPVAPSTGTVALSLGLETYFYQ